MRPAPKLAALIFAAPTLVAAETHIPAPGALSAFEAVGRYVIQTGLQFARTFVELRYDDITVNFTEGAIGVHGLSIRPPADLDLPDDCVLSMESIEISSETIRDYGAARLDLTGLDVPLSCLPPEPQVTLATLGYERLRADTVSIDYDYDASSSALNAVIRGVFEDGFEIDAAVGFDYFWLQIPLDDVGDFNPDQPPVSPEPEPIADLSFLEISLSDSGGLERATPMIQGMLGSLDQAPLMVQGGLLDALATPGADNSAVEAFAVEAAAAVDGFLKNGDRLVVTIRPETPLRLNEDLFEDPQTLFAALAPRASGILENRREIVDPALLAAALGDGAGVSDADRLAAGRALATGLGAPKSRDAALQALGPLIEQGDAEAAMLGAEALAETDADAAYRLALIAASGGAPGAQALLNRAERSLSAEAALSAQEDALGDTADLEAEFAGLVANDDIGAIRSLAEAAARGRGLTRHVAVAYGAARLAAAAGDRGAAALADRLARRYGRRADGAVWIEAMEEAAASAAAEFWIQGGLGARLMAQ